MSEKILQFDEWKQGYFDKLKAKKRLSPTERLIDGLVKSETKVAKRSLDSALKNLYVQYKNDLRVKSALLEQAAKVKKVFAKEQEQKRKQRTHELVKLGGLVRAARFTEDEQLLSGALQYVKKQIGGNQQLQDQLKALGKQYLESLKSE